MQQQFSRTALLIGSEAIARLENAHVALFGVGGVGSFVAEALARAGVGAIDLIDNDQVSESNINRQLVALHSTIGRLKVDVMKERLLDINPQIHVKTMPMFYLPENAHEIDFSDYDYIIDCIDTVKAKIDIVVRATELKIPVISAMGAGNKLDPTAFEIADLYKTSVCPLARVMRTELKKRGVSKLKVVYSKEPPRRPLNSESCEEPTAARRSTPGSVSFCPSVAGLILAGEVIKDISDIC